MKQFSEKQLPTDKQLKSISFSKSDYETLVRLLHRHPNLVELEMFGGLWSEHCGYKHTKKLITKFSNISSKSENRVGEENAGVIDISDKIKIVFKIESHNHPSYVEPVQGAATGVGGIIRDILAMGARPVAILDSLRFGKIEPKKTTTAEINKTKFLFNGVVTGVGDYANCVGVPCFGGETFFDSSYQENPLVNVMCIGLIDDGNVLTAHAKSSRDAIYLVGAKTGRDGIHGASGLASTTIDELSADRSTVQVGDPFIGKLLIESCLEAKNLPIVNGLQDCGAAGLTSSLAEMAGKSNLGVLIDLDKVPLKDEKMKPEEILLSESQERMIFAIGNNEDSDFRAVFEKWEIDCAKIGKFTENPSFVATLAGKVVANIPIKTLISPPLVELEVVPRSKIIPKTVDWNPYIKQIYREGDTAKTLKNIYLDFLGSPNISKTSYIYERYDRHVQNRTVQQAGGYASLLWLRETGGGLAISCVGNSRLTAQDPFIGSQIAVCEACRYVSTVGATPLALTDGLNFGNPETKLVQKQITSAIDGIIEACKKLQVPVLSGNVSLYNESINQAIKPTVIIGAIGNLDDLNSAVDYPFNGAQQLLFLLGTDKIYDPNGLSCSEFASYSFGTVAGSPFIDLELECRLQKMLIKAAQEKVISSAHPLSYGGLAVAITEAAIESKQFALQHFSSNKYGINGYGASLTLKLKPNSNCLVELFGETQSRVLCGVKKENKERLINLAKKHNITYCEIGETISEPKIIFSDLFEVTFDEIKTNFLKRKF